MEKDLKVGQRSSYISGASCMMSPSCFPVHDEFQYSRIQNCPSKRGRRWRNLLRKFIKESKTFYGSNKPPSFQYDPVSYSQNFDDGFHLDQPRRLSYVFQDVSDAALDRLDCRCKV